MHGGGQGFESPQLHHVLAKVHQKLAGCSQNFTAHIGSIAFFHTSAAIRITQLLSRVNFKNLTPTANFQINARTEPGITSNPRVLLNSPPITEKAFTVPESTPIYEATLLNFALLSITILNKITAIEGMNIVQKRSYRRLDYTGSVFNC